MQSIKKLFRNIYYEEDIYTLATYTNGQWNYELENVPKTINNVRHGQTAVVIGNGLDRLTFNLKNLKNRKLQTYGCNALYRDFSPDFLVSVGSEMCDEIARSGYCNNHVVYAYASEIVRQPKKFHLIPQNPTWNAGSLAAYLACFDGHTKVYLLGFDGNDTPGYSNNIYNDTPGYYSVHEDQNDLYWSLTMTHVFKTYLFVDFVLVNSTGRGYMPKAWQSVPNLRRISFNELVLECDL